MSAFRQSGRGPNAGVPRRRLAAAVGADGRELFYTALDGALMSVPSARGRTFSAGTPVALLRNGATTAGWRCCQRRGTYDVAPDGSDS